LAPKNGIFRAFLTGFDPRKLPQIQKVNMGVNFPSFFNVYIKKLTYTLKSLPGGQIPHHTPTLLKIVAT
jgi:hypothetical protein